jgi:hypothetical protein
MKKSRYVRGLPAVAALTLIAVGAAGCGSSSKNAASSSATTASTTPPGQGTNTSTAPPTTVGTLRGSSGSSFCDLARHDQAAFSSANIATATPAQLKNLYGNLGSALEQARSAAPDAIKGDFDTFVTAFTPFLNTFAAANYDYTKLTPAAVAGLGTPQVKAASAHITQYMQQVCKITTTPTT